MITLVYYNFLWGSGKTPSSAVCLGKKCEPSNLKFSHTYSEDLKSPLTLTDCQLLAVAVRTQFICRMRNYYQPVCQMYNLIPVRWSTLHQTHLPCFTRSFQMIFKVDINYRYIKVNIVTIFLHMIELSMLKSVLSSLHSHHNDKELQKLDFLTIYCLLFASYFYCLSITFISLFQLFIHYS